ncbi:MAG: hypothetical protein V4760_00750 [Bdellovibrionota bacterium]
MKRLVLLICFAFSTATWATETTLEDVAAVQPLANKWSTALYFQGGRSDSGIGIGLETPTFHSLGFRLIYSFDNLDDSARSFTFNTLEAAIKWQLVRGSSEGIVPYALVGANFFAPVKSATETGGSKSGSEFGIGTEWRYNAMGILNDNTNLASVFFELIKASSTFASATTAAGGVVVHDGALFRLGFRAFF